MNIDIHLLRIERQPEKKDGMLADKQERMITLINSIAKMRISDKTAVDEQDLLAFIITSIIRLRNKTGNLGEVVTIIYFQEILSQLRAVDQGDLFADIFYCGRIQKKKIIMDQTERN